MKIVIDNKIPFTKGILEPYAEVEYVSADHISNSLLKSADALLIRSVTKCDRSLLEGTQVKIIATATIGFDHIDTGYCQQNGISWKNAPGCNSTAVQQYTINALLYLGKTFNIDITKLTLGIVGVGNIGSKVAASTHALGMTVLLNDPPRQHTENSDEFIDIEVIKNQANIITFHVPLNLEGKDKTYHMVDEKFIAELKRNPFIINTARGEVIDSEALYYSIREKRLQKPILDVWENEPYIKPYLIDEILLGTAHIAGYSIEGKARGTLMAILEIADFFGIDIDKKELADKIMPQKQNIMVNCKNQNDTETINSLLSNTYDIENDNQLFKYNYHNFEKLRSEYNYRHDYSGYQLMFMNCEEKTKKKFQALGFELI